MRRKVISMLLALTLCMSLSPVGAFAAGTSDTVQKTEPALASGTASDTLSQESAMTAEPVLVEAALTEDDGISTLDAGASIGVYEQGVIAYGIPIVIKQNGSIVSVFDEDGTLLSGGKDVSALNIYGGCFSATYLNGYTGGDTSITVESGVLTGNIYGGNYDGGTVTGNSNITIEGGTINGNIFGGSDWAGEIAGTANLTFEAGATVNGWVFGGGRASTTSTGSTNLVINGGTFAHHVYGGGAWGPVTGDTHIAVNGGTISASVFGGNEDGGKVSGSTYITIEDGVSLGYLYGGGAGFSDDVITEVGGSTNITVNGGHIDGNVYGGGGWRGAVVGSSNVTFNGGVATGSLYGGGEEESRVTGKATIVQTGGEICGIIGPGGGFGNEFVDDTVATVGSVDITVSGGTYAQGGYYIDAACGVGYQATVLGDVTVTLKNRAIPTFCAAKDENKNSIHTAGTTKLILEGFGTESDFHTIANGDMFPSGASTSGFDSVELKNSHMKISTTASLNFENFVLGEGGVLWIEPNTGCEIDSVVGNGGTLWKTDGSAQTTIKALSDTVPVKLVTTAGGELSSTANEAKLLFLTNKDTDTATVTCANKNWELVKRDMTVQNQYEIHNTSVSFTEQSPDATITLGDTVPTFRVAVERNEGVPADAQIQYQWLVSDTMIINGAEAATYTPTITTDGTYRYTCRVYCNGVYNYSRTMTLVVNPEPVASVTIDGTTEKYPTLSLAFNAAKGKTADLQLLKDTDISRTFTVDEGIFTLDLHGKAQTGNAITVTGGSLTVVDVVEGNAGKLGTLTVSGGTVKLAAGTYAGIAVTTGTVADLLGENCAYKDKDGNYITDTAVTALENVTVTDAPVASITRTTGGITAIVGYYGTFKGALEAVQDDDTVTLLQDTEYYGSIDAKILTLDLKGNTLTATYGLPIYGGGSLTVKDSTDDHSGKITCSASMGYKTISVDNGSFTLESGTIEQTTQYATAVSASYSDTSNITIKGGHVVASGNGVNIPNGTVEISGGIVECTGLRTCKALNVGNDVSLTLSGGTFKAPVGGTSINSSDAGKITGELLADGYCYYVGETADVSTGTVADASRTTIQDTVTVGKAAVASVTIGDTTTKYDTLSGAIDAIDATDAARVTLLRNVTLDEPLNIGNGGESNDIARNITLDLKGCTLAGRGEYALAPQEGTKLTVVDSSDPQSGQVKNISVSGSAIDASDSDWTGALAVTGGTFIGSGEGCALDAGANGDKVSLTGGIYSNNDTDFTVYADNGVGAMLATGYAYRQTTGDRSWVTVDSNDLSLKGSVSVQAIPVRITGPLVAPTPVTYGYTDTQTLRVTAELEPGKEMGCQWYTGTEIAEDGSNEIPGATSASYEIPIGLGAGDTKYFCAVLCDGYTLTTNVVTFTVNRAPQTALNVTGQRTAVTYGDKFTLGTEGGSGTGAVTWSVTSGTAATVGETTGEVAVIGTGEVTITATKAADDNYSPAATASYTFTAAQRIAELNWANTELVYTGSDQKPTATVSNLVEGDTCTVTVSGEKTNHGTYTATATALSNANYARPADATHGFTIAAKTLTTSMVSQPADVTYDGTAQSPVVTVADGTALTANDYSLEYTNSKDAGVATLKVVAKGNYTGTVTKNFTVKPKPLTVTANAQSKAYGEADPTLSYVASGLVEGDSLVGALSRAEGETIGNYDIFVGTLSAGNNYQLSYTAAKLSIGKADASLNVALNPVSQMVGKDVTVTVIAQNAATATLTEGATQPALEGITLTAPAGTTVKTALHQTASGEFQAVYTVNADAALGAVNFVASMKADSCYNAPENATATLTVTDKNTVKLSLSADKSTGVTYGDSVTYTAELVADQILSPSWQTLGGAVTLWLGEPNVTGSVQIASGKADAKLVATLDYSKLTAGTHTVYATYSGSDSFSSAQTNTATVVAKKQLSWNTEDLKADKPFDGTVAASVSGNLTVDGVVGSDALNFSYDSLSGSFADGKPGADKSVTVAVAGATMSNENYLLPQNSSFAITSTISAVGALPVPTESTDGTQLMLVVAEGVPEVPDALKDNTALNTPEKIEAVLKVSVDDVLGSTANLKLMDVNLWVSTDGGKTWEKASLENFPAGGITVEVPFSALGITSEQAKNMNFSVVHMFAETANGHTAGEVEMPAWSLTENSVKFVVTGLSPIVVAYVERQTVTFDPGASGSADGNAGGNGQLAATGDSTNMALYLLLALMSGSVVVGIGVARRMGRRSGVK